MFSNHMKSEVVSFAMDGEKSQMTSCIHVHSHWTFSLQRRGEPMVRFIRPFKCLGYRCGPPKDFFFVYLCFVNTFKRV
jgi:hypothetical protein